MKKYNMLIKVCMVLAVVFIPMIASTVTCLLVSDIVSTYHSIDIERAIFTWPTISLTIIVFVVTLNESIKKIFL